MASGPRQASKGWRVAGWHACCGIESDDFQVSLAGGVLVARRHEVIRKIAEASMESGAAARRLRTAGSTGVDGRFGAQGAPGAARSVRRTRSLCYINVGVTEGTVAPPLVQLR